MFKTRRRVILLIVILLVVAGVLLRRQLTGVRVKDGSFLLIALDGQYVEEPPSDLLTRLFTRAPRTLSDLLNALKLAKSDKRIAGTILQVSSLDIGWAKSQDIRHGLAAFKAAGKPVYAVLEQEGAVANKEYFIASVASRVYVSPATTAPFVGLAGQYIFLGGVWEKLDIEMHVEKIREYKTAGDMLVNKEMSPYHREMANSLLDSVNEHFVSAIAEARGLEPDRVRSLIDEGPTTGEEFQTAGLSDGIKYATDVRKEDAGDAPVVEVGDYQNIDPESAGISPTSTIAIVYGVGPIILGEGGSSMLDGPVMGSTTVTKALKDAADNSEAKAIIFRVDSPGGSALASDLIWKATQEAKEKKPVIVSMSDVAGSGGYYVAAGATRILAQPMTLTGSIGVVFAKPDIEGLLNRLGVTSETITRGKYARINDLTDPYDDAMREKLMKEMNGIYDVFVSRVATGRRLTPERVNEIGRGRVWTGAQAVDNGLVDETGGLADAIRAAKAAAGIAETEEVELVYYPRRKTFAARLAEALTTRVVLSRISLPWLKQWRAALALYPFTEPGVLALMPEQIEIR